MAAKLLHSLSDDNPDLQKQIGCMTGIFQHMLTNTTRRLPPGNSHIRNDSLERESNDAQPKSSSLDKYSYTNMQERQRYSIESSRPSFSSSSHSSSFSSLDCNRATQLEPAPFDRMLFPDTPSRDSAMSLQNTLPQYNRQSVDLRDLVKESIYRDSQGSSDKKQSTPADIKESLRILAKLQEAPRYTNEPRALSRSSSYHYKDGSSFSVTKDAPRFSYDGREIYRSSFESRDGSNSALKIKELPRLSLDSRESSMRSLGADSLSKSVQKDSGGIEGKVQNQKQEHGNQARLPSVVAKLMGLDTLPNSASSSDNNKMGSTRSDLAEHILLSPEKTYKMKPVQLSSPSKNSWKEPSSPRWRNPDSPVKSTSRLPIEPAPWKQNDGVRSSQKSASKTARAPAKAPTMFPSVYSEIEKRLGDLEFTQSGKDLRALKQILEAMQAKGLLETTNEGQDSNFISHEDHKKKFLSSARSVDNQKLQADQVPSITKRKTLPTHNLESPIVIMKPARLAEKYGVPAGSVISLNGLSSQRILRGSESADNIKGSNSGRTSKDLVLKSSQQENTLCSVNMNNSRTSTKSQQLPKAGSAELGKTTGSIIPRTQQKKLEQERRSRPPTPPDSSKSRRQSNKLQVESNSPGGRRRAKHIYPQKSDEQLSEVSVESRNSNPNENEDSAESNENIIRSSGNVEYDSSDRAPVSTNLQSSSSEASQFMQSGMVEKNSTLMLTEEEAADIGCVPPEYSSPISVLDNAVYTLGESNSPSPIKYTGKTLKVDVPIVNERDPSAAEECSLVSYVSSSVESGSAFDYNRKKLQNIDNLVQKLRRLNSSHDEARTDYIASLCENANPDHRYISEILLASGLLLRDLGSGLTDFQFHPSGHPINPELFLVLEQTRASSSSHEVCMIKATTKLTGSEKLNRKLIFDAVNETLATKLASTGPHSEPWCRPLKLIRKALNDQNLLKELCSEIDKLQTKNPKYSSDEEENGWKTILCQDPLLLSENWINFEDDISGAVLDIERLIFKDLVDEIVRGESAGSLTKPGRRKASAK